MPSFAPGRDYSRHLLWTAGTLALLLAFDASGLDLAMARWFGGAGGFPWQQSWLLEDVLHEGARKASSAVAIWLVAGIWWPTGVLDRLARDQRVQLVLTTFMGLLVISLFKHTSRTSCPWDLQEFGGVANYVSHWAWGLGDGGAGHCFPAGHASAGFAFVGGYFVLRPGSPRLAWAWLAAVLVAGTAFGVAQQMRGAHFMSHTLWTGWLCWTTAWIADAWLFPAFRPAARALGTPAA